MRGPVTGLLDPKHALDKIHESWSLFWLFPKHRRVAAGASLANSVTIRYQHDTSYRPSNLNLSNGAPSGYQAVAVVAAPTEA